MKAHSFLAPSASLLGAIFPLLCTAQQQSTDHGQFTPATVPGVASYFEKIDSDGDTIIHRSIEVDSPDEPGKKVLIGQVLKKLKNGNLLILPGQQPEDADIYRQKICQKIGGIDVTNQSHVVIGIETLDGGSCKQPNSKASKQLPKAGAIVNGIFKESPEIENNEDSGTNAPAGLQATTNYVNPVAPSTSTIVNQNFFAIGTLILPLFHRHPVKRFNSLSEVNDEAEGKRETDPAALQRRVQGTGSAPC